METSHRTKESKEDDQVAMATGGGPPVPLKARPAINLMVIDNHLNIIHVLTNRWQRL